MVSLNAADVFPAKFASPAYLAVIECEPGAKFEMENCAALLDKLAPPSEVVPSKNVTAPLAWSPLMEGVTEAVSVMVCPNVAGFKLTETETVELAGPTVSVRALELLPV